MSTQHVKKIGVLAAGLALFSMFFGAGDLLWPLILGGQSGDKNFFAMLGLLITGVSLPLLGVISIALFRGNFRAFFGQTGKIPGFILILAIQLILGPFGTIPRLMTLSHATLKPYLPEMFSLPIFSICACALVYLFTIKRHRIVDILGLALTPILLLSLGLILILGFIHPPAALASDLSSGEAFFKGFNVGYNTLDLIASFIFAPLVLSYFQNKEATLDTPESRKLVFKKTLKASLIAGALLTGMYIGLTYIASFYMSVLPMHLPEERLAVIAIHLMGTKGALLSCLAVSFVCLTTAIPISVMSADYIHTDFMKGKGSYHVALLIALGTSAAVANLGFMGIAAMLSPILQILCPGLIILSILSVCHKLYEMKMRRAPIFVAFGLSIVSYLSHV